MRRIVVGVDGTPGGEAAVQWALHEAIEHPACLELVYVAELSTMDFVFRSEEIEDQMAATGQRHLECAAERCRTQGVDCSTRLEFGLAGPVLLDVADGGLLVIGTRRRGKVAGVLLGSASSHCVQHATGPVLVVPAHAPLEHVPTEKSPEV